MGAVVQGAEEGTHGLLRDGHRAGGAVRPAARCAEGGDRGPCGAARRRHRPHGRVLARSGRGDLPRRLGTAAFHAAPRCRGEAVGPRPGTLRSCAGAGHRLRRGTRRAGRDARRHLPFDGGLEDPFLALADPGNRVTGLMGVPADIGDEMLKIAWRVFAKGGEEAVVPWLKSAYGFKAAGKWLGPAGDVLTGVFAGVDRWNEDAGDPSLSTGERATRAAVDGGVNAAGALAGGIAGAKGGAALGAAIGSVIPGAGTAVGGAVGGIVGGVVGGIVGGGVADAAIDWILG